MAACNCSTNGPMCCQDHWTHQRILDDFREAWGQVMRGETRPIAELWSLLDDDDPPSPALPDHEDTP